MTTSDSEARGAASGEPEPPAAVGGARGVLFLCVANSARSQIAEALARRRFSDRAVVMSAGSMPSALHPFAVEALAEVGIDASAQRSKSLDEIAADAVHVVVTLCAEEVCPTYLGHARRLHWPLPDPAKAGVDDMSRERILDRFRSTVDAIEARLGELDALLD